MTFWIELNFEAIKDMLTFKISYWRSAQIIICKSMYATFETKKQPHPFFGLLFL